MLRVRHLALGVEAIFQRHWLVCASPPGEVRRVAVLSIPSQPGAPPRPRRRKPISTVASFFSKRLLLPPKPPTPAAWPLPFAPWSASWPPCDLRFTIYDVAFRGLSATRERPAAGGAAAWTRSIIRRFGEVCTVAFADLESCRVRRLDNPNPADVAQTQNK